MYSQDFLRLAYGLQQNNSNAVINVQHDLYRIIQSDVCRVVMDSRWYYFISKDNADIVANYTKFARGKRPKRFNDDDCMSIKQLKGEGDSNYSIATKYHCSEKTIRNILNNKY